MAKLKIANRFGVTPNHILNNPNLSFKAKGLFGYIQSKPDDWDFSIERISLEAKESIDAIRTGLKELESFGFLVRQKYQNQNGYWEIDYILHENPILENPTKEVPAKENNTNNSNKDFKKQDLSNNNSLSRKKSDFENFSNSENENKGEEEITPKSYSEKEKKGCAEKKEKIPDLPHVFFPQAQRYKDAHQKALEGDFMAKNNKYAVGSVFNPEPSVEVMKKLLIKKTCEAHFDKDFLIANKEKIEKKAKEVVENVIKWYKHDNGYWFRKSNNGDDFVTDWESVLFYDDMYKHLLTLKKQPQQKLTAKEKGEQAWDNTSKRFKSGELQDNFKIFNDITFD